MEEKIDLEKFKKHPPANRFIEALFKQKVNKSCFGRTGIFLRTLNQPRINLVCLKSYAFRGIPNECIGLRVIIWRILLNYLPAETNTWDDFLQHKQKEYKELCEKYKLPILTKQLLRYTTITPELELAKGIKIDMKRTKQEIEFFSMAPLVSIEESKEQIGEMKDDKYDFLYDNKETHRLVISRILYVYANTNAGMGYIQGMNEMIAVIYYCFYNDSSEELKAYAESDTYFCFSNLMFELKDLYFKEKEKIASGLKGKIEKISEVLKRIEPKYWSYLESIKIDMLLLTMRWIMLIFAQDLPITSTIRLWDSILGDSERFLFFDYLIVQLFIELKEKMSELEFYELARQLNENLKSMQLKKLLKNTGNMLAKDLKKDQYIGEHY